MSNLNYFALEPAIKARVEAEMPELEEVYTPFSVDQMLQLTNASPSVSIIYAGDRVGDSVGNGKANAVYQQWLVVLSVNEASAQLGDTSQIRTIAAPLITKLLEALQGWNPQVPRYKVLMRVNAGVSVGSDDSGNAYFPFLFESQMLVV